MPEISVQRLDADLPLPRQAHEGDAGVDLYAREDVVLAPSGGRALMPTGIAIAIPLGFAGLVNAPGLIDSHYRGELKVVLLNTDPSNPYQIHRGDRIAQLVIQRVEEVTWTEVDSLDENNRGGGFGHSGR